MHKNTKITPTLRREIYAQWKNQGNSFRSIAERYHVDKNIISKIVLRGKMGDFSVHDSTNHRYRRIEFGLKRLAEIERNLAIKIQKRERRNNRFERESPGELVHGDTKRLPQILRKDRYRQVLAPSEVLFVWIDDYSRWLAADILPDRTMWSGALFLETMSVRLPFAIETHYSDNGGEFKGNNSHAFAAGCARLGIQQKFTKPKHPWTNGKAERVIKTIMEKWYRVNQRTFMTADQRRQSLYQFVDWYNHCRPHQSLKGLTPVQKLAQFFEKSGDNA